MREGPATADVAADKRYMGTALALGELGLGLTAPNPSVGALVVDPHSGAILGRGTTQPGGRPHAEFIALQEAGEAARGAWLYVSLEPCSHFGYTAPCADHIIKAGIARVVSAMEDPDPRVAGRGHQRLRDAGIVTEVGVLASQAERLNAGHTSRIVKGRPHLTLKLAVSADDMIGMTGQGQVSITGDQTNAYVHMMRAKADAILVGVGTARIDDPSLTCRLPGMADRSPIRVIADTRLDLSVSANVFSSQSSAVWVLTCEDAPREKSAALEEKGAEILRVPCDERGRLSLPFAMAALAARGVTRLMVEGGARMAESLLRGNLVDEAVISRNPNLTIGSGGVKALGSLCLSAITDDRRFREIETLELGGDTIQRFWRAG